MAVYTIMAENAEGSPFKLHNESVREAAQGIATVERFKLNGLRNIRIYKETQEIDLATLTADAAAQR